MEIRLGTSSTTLRRVAHVKRCDGEWHQVLTTWIDGPHQGEYTISEDATDREIAAVTLAVACEGAKLAAASECSPGAA